MAGAEAGVEQGPEGALSPPGMTGGPGPGKGPDWAGGLPLDVLAKVAETLVAQPEAALAARWKRDGVPEAEIQERLEKRKRLGPSRGLFVFARVCKPWRKAQLKVGGPLRTRLESDVILPGSVALAKWALAEVSQDEAYCHWWAGRCQARTHRAGEMAVRGGGLRDGR